MSGGIRLETKTSEHRSQNMPSLQPPKTYDAVIVTIPFGCLKERQVAFHPDIPQGLAHAIDSITYGNLEKVYIRFPEAYWLTTETPHPFFTHFLHPSFTSQNKKHWDIGVVSLAAGPNYGDETSHPTLLFYVYGPCGTHVTNMITGLEPSDPKYIQSLTKFFEPYYSRLPNYDATQAQCKPVAMLATDWQHDHLAGHGSYTNWQIDDNDKLGLPPKMPLDDAIVALRHGMPERNIFFAGEHTSPFAALGTVTGAYLSGEAVAERVVQHFAEHEQGHNPGMAEHDVVHPHVEKEKLSGDVQVGKGVLANAPTFDVQSTTD